MIRKTDLPLQIYNELSSDEIYAEYNTMYSRNMIGNKAADKLLAIIYTAFLLP